MKNVKSFKEFILEKETTKAEEESTKEPKEEKKEEKPIGLTPKQKKNLPKPLQDAILKSQSESSKYSIHATKEDYEKIYDEIRSIEPKLKKPLNWKKIKSSSYEQLQSLVDILKRKVDVLKEGRGVWKDKWEKDDLILTYYYSVYGTRGLGLSERELAQDIIGSSLNSLKMQSSNFDFLKGYTGLDRPHTIQSEVFNEFHGSSQDELRKICLNIINKKGGESGKIFQDKIRQRNMKKELDKEFIKRGFDPKKMKSLGVRPTLQSMLDDES